MILFHFIWAFQVIEKSLLYYCDANVVEFIFDAKNVNIGRCFFFFIHVLVFTNSNIFTHGEDEIVLFLILYDIIGHQ